MEEALFYILIGFAIIYGMVHFYVVQFTKTWSQRSVYERFLTVASAVALALMIAGM